MKNKLSPGKGQKFGPVVTTNFTILWICLCFILELVTLGMNMWYIRQDDEIKYWHGGLWNQCLGEIDRTFCSYNSETPGWLRATQAMVMIALFLMFVDIVYIMVGVARKALRLSVMLGLTNFTTLFLFIGVLVYTLKGYSDKISPGNTFYIAWVTVACHVIGGILSFISFLKVTKISKKQSVDYGLKP